MLIVSIFVRCTYEKCTARIYYQFLSPKATSNGPLVSLYLQKGYDCILYDLRGHGENEPHCCTYSILEGLHFIPGADHAQSVLTVPEEYAGYVYRFLEHIKL